VGGEGRGGHTHASEGGRREGQREREGERERSERE